VQAFAERHGRRGLATGWCARAAAVLMCVVAACAALVLMPASADAHPLSTTAILLEFGSDQVTGQVQLPIDRLAIALDQPTLTATAVDQPATLEELRQYVAAHISATNAADGATWAVDVASGHVETIDDVEHLVYDLMLRPPNGNVRDVQLHYDGIVHHLLSHRIFVSSRRAGTGIYTAVGITDWETQTVTGPPRAQPPSRGSWPRCNSASRTSPKAPTTSCSSSCCCYPPPCWPAAGGGCAPTTSVRAAFGLSTW
jgi:hypothetical protein